MHLLICAEDSQTELRAELRQAFPGMAVETTHPSLLQVGFDVPAQARLPCLAFARQWLPHARQVRAESVRAWTGELLSIIVGILPDHAPWSLHIEPQYGAPAGHRIGARAWHSAVKSGRANGLTSSREPLQPASEPGRHRCGLIRQALVEALQQKRRHLLRHLRRAPGFFTVNESLVQLLLTAPDTGFVSVARAPLPFAQRHLLSPFPKGGVPVASDQWAPSRAFAKLVEAERRLGLAIQSGETCVDLGAAPGSWTYVAAHRGARVIAVDRSPLREDLMARPEVEFRTGDAFRFRPRSPVDWLLCDVIAAPERTSELLLHWLRCGWCHRFIVTLKMKDTSGLQTLLLLKRELPPLTRELFLVRLCANKKEVCVFGARNQEGN